MASAFEHKTLTWLRSRFEQGDIPTGADFARLIDSCHNSLAHTDSIITGTLTVSGDITCMGSVNGTQSIVTNDPRVESLIASVDTLSTFITTNSASWNNTVTIDDITLDESLEYLYSKFQDGDTPTQEDFQLLINTSHNTYAHENTYLSDLLTVVRTNSAAWFSGDGSGGPDLTGLITTVSANSGDWSSHTDVTSLSADLESLSTAFQINSGDWLDNWTDIQSRAILYSSTSVISSGTTLGYDGNPNNVDPNLSLGETVLYNSDIGTLYVQSDGSMWRVESQGIWRQIDPSQESGVNSALTNIITYVQSRSAQWDLTESHHDAIIDIENTLNIFQAASAAWNDSSVLTSLESTVNTYSAEWFSDGNLQLESLTTTISTNSGDWSDHTDITDLQQLVDYTVEDVIQNELDIGSITGYVQSNSGAWLEKTDISSLTSIVSAYSAKWPVFESDIIDLYHLIADLDLSGDSNTSVYNTVNTYSGIWDSRSDITYLSTGLDSLTSTVSTNSASWSETTSTTSSSSGGAVGAFITEVTCGDNANVNNGIVEPLYDIDEIPVNSNQPLVSALVDTSDVRFYLQWEGPAEEWTGTPTVSGHEVPRTDTTAIGGNHARRFEGYIDFDLSAYTGTTATINYSYQGLEKSVDLEIAGGGPEIVNFEFISTPDHGQDHYKDGDTIEFVVMFNTTDVISYSLQGANDTASKTYTNESVTMNGVSATITAECDTTVTSITDLPVRIKAKNALGTETPNWYESIPTVPVLNGPVITNVTFGAYPGTQTELKDGDTVPVTFEFDTNNVNRVETSGNGNNSYASSNQTLNVTTASFSGAGTMTVDTSLENNAGGFERPIRAKARHSSQQFGNQHDSAEKLTVNNQKPTFSAASITYPSNQEAIKTTETATVNIVVNNEGDTAQATYTYTGNGRNELSIPDTSTYSADKVVTYANGTYNINSANYKLEVNRQENNNTASKTATVFIADALPTINITTNNGTDMRSGGEDGTTMQNYNVVIASDQRLIENPSIVAPVGTLSSGVSPNGSNTQFTTTIGIHDNNNRGTHTYTTLNAKNLAGQTQNTINSGSDYTIRGFVLRTLTVASQGWQVQATVAAVNYNKVEIDWEKKALTIQALLGDTTRPQSSTWSLDRLDPAPITVNILDSGATIASSNATSLTIEEKL